MDKYKKEEVKYKIAKHQKKINTVIYIFVIILVYILYSLLFKKIIVDVGGNINIGLIGALLGAIIGGLMAMFGSIYVANKKIKCESEIERKNKIYRPLYDELMEFKNVFTKSNPFPYDIEFYNKSKVSKMNPGFIVWNHIKNDTRLIETPVIINSMYSELENKIDEYIEIRHSIGLPLKLKLEEVFESEHINTRVANLGQTILSDIIFKVPKGRLTLLGLPQDKYDIIEEKIYKQCNELNEVQNIIIKNQELEDLINKTIRLLENMIKTINIKYEKKF